MQKKENNWFQKIKILETKIVEKNNEISNLNGKIQKLEREKTLKQLKEEF